MDKRKFLFSLAIIIVITLTMSSIVWSDDWLCYSWDKNTKVCRQYFYKIIERKLNIVKVQTRLPITNEVMSTIDSLKEDDSQMIISKMIDCQDRTLSVIKTVVYKTDGTVSSSVDGDVSVKYQIDPHSQDGALFRFVCKSSIRRTK